MNIPRTVLATIGIFLGTAAILFFMGRPLVYKDGPLKIWTPDPQSHETSQQISDPYTFTHVAHGILLYGAVSVLPPHISYGSRFVIALATEALWEVFENTPFVIDRYRTETISLDYYGDSVINALFDIVAALVGFFLASRLSLSKNLLLLLLIELALYFWIGDGLLLNIIQLL